MRDWRLKHSMNTEVIKVGNAKGHLIRRIRSHMEVTGSDSV